MNTETKIKNIKERFISLTDEVLNDLLTNIDLEQYPQLKPKYLNILPSSIKTKILCECLFSNNPDRLEQIYKNLTREISNSLDKAANKKRDISKIKKKLEHYEQLLKTEENELEKFKDLSLLKMK